MSRTHPGWCAALFAAVLLAGCSTPAVQAPSLQLTRTSFTALPGWSGGSLDAALAAFRRGCAVLKARDPQATMGGAGYGGLVADWLGSCASDDGDARHFFESQFIAYAVRGDGLFTGYFEPEIKVSDSRQGAFQTPVYGLPPDLVRADLGLFSTTWKGDHIAGRLDGQRLVPYADRAAIEEGGAAAPVLLYTDDPVALFFLQIQGSGRARRADGSVVRLAYAGDNGQPYTAIGRVLIAEGALTKETVSLQSIRAWLAAHPERAQAVMQADKSYVFFRAVTLDDPALGSTGTMGVNITPLGSLAVDARIHALGAPVYVAAEGAEPLNALLIAQDTGGAIRGAVRGDIFFGAGDAAEARAGAMKAPGRMFVLLPTALAQKIGGSWTAP